MGDHLYVYSIHDLIYVSQFNQAGVHKVRPEFDEDMLITIGKKWDDEENGELHNKFQNEEGDLKVRVTDSMIDQINTLSPSTKMLAVHS